MVCEGEVPAVLPPAAGGRRQGRGAGGALRRSGFLNPADLKTRLSERAAALGFDAFGVASADPAPEAAARLSTWLAADHHAGMGWMADRPARRASPTGLWPEARAVILLGRTTAADVDPIGDLARRDQGLSALYAARRDYHDVIKGRLKELAALIPALGGGQVKVFVDTAPVLEKTLAAAAGLGWQGKHSVLVSRRHGSWLLLGAIYTDIPLPSDESHADRCGTCRRCLDICPTDAFPEPYVLDARRCLSYWTIEHHGTIPEPFRSAMGNRVFGCDDCLAVCPWNRFAEASRDARMALRPEIRLAPLAELAALDDAAFRARYAGTPIKRTGRDRFLRNVMIAIGNSADPRLAGVAARGLTDVSPLVRAMAVWALMRLDIAEARRRRADSAETDPGVLAEWAALDQRAAR